ncbi:MAG: AEC family transporter [Clostridia bacterium]|nr:AEC family transporter [Clostridia bacterium]
MATEVVFNQVAALFIFAIIGYVLAKTNIVNRAHSKILSVLGVYVFMPAKFFKTFAENFTPYYISTKYVYLIISLAVLFVLVLLSKQAAKLFSRDKYERNVFQYTMTIPNFGYMGYVLAEAIYGSAALTNIMMLGLPISVYTNTEGYRMLTGTGGFTLKKIFNPMFVATIVGCVWGYFGLPVPAVARTVLDSASGCAGAVSMLLMGIVVAEQKLLSIVVDFRIYITVAIRLFVIPGLVGGAFFAVLPLLGFSADATRELVRYSLMIFAMPCGLNTIVFPKLVGKDCKLGAGFALVSVAASLFSIPFWLTVWG